MAIRITALLCLCAAAAPAWRQELEPGSFQDKSGNMFVKNLDAWRVERVDKATLRFTARAQSGKQLIAQWKAQGLTIEATTLKGTAKLGAKSTMDLLSASMGGGTKTVSTRPSADPQSKVPQTATILAQTADFDAAENTVTSPGALSLASHDPGTQQKFDAKGSRGKVTLAKTGRGAVQGAVLEGPIEMTLKGVREETDEKTKKTVHAPYTVTGKGGKLVYSAAENTITLTGDVRISGDDPMFGGDIRASRAVITLDAKGEIASIDFDGPGETVLKERKGGG